MAFFSFKKDSIKNLLFFLKFLLEPIKPSEEAKVDVEFIYLAANLDHGSFICPILLITLQENY